MWLVLLPPTITLFGAVLYSRTIPNEYQSDMLIAIIPQRVPDTFVRSTVTLRTEERLDAISVQIQSRSNLEQMIQEFNLYPEARRLMPMEDVVQLMRNSIQVQLEQGRPTPGSRGTEGPHAFHVRFTSTDPNLAARVTQRLGALFVEQNSRDRGALAQATDQFLESQLLEARRRLEEQERRLEAFRERHGHELPTQLQTNMQAIQSTQLQVQALVESIARDRDRKLMLERLHREAANEPPVAQVASLAPNAQQPGGATPVSGTAQQQLAAARASLAALELRLRPEHPDVVRTRRLVAELEPKAKAESEFENDTTSTAAPPTSIEEARHRERLSQMAAEIESLDRQTKFKESEERRLREVVAEYQRRIEAVPSIESEWTALSRDYQTLQTNYEALLNKSEAAKVAVDLERRQIGEHFRIVDPAGVPVHPVSSKRMVVNAAGFTLGLLIGLGIAAFLELRDASFRSEADILDVLALPVLALVPTVETHAERVQRFKRRLVVVAGAVLCGAGMAYTVWALRLWDSII
jgi:polysaccharide chain length determinant protein (PEP-CTERM system associated)